jgi:hypothetical protein
MAKLIYAVRNLNIPLAQADVVNAGQHTAAFTLIVPEHGVLDSDAV